MTLAGPEAGAEVAAETEAAAAVAALPNPFPPPPDFPPPRFFPEPFFLPFSLSGTAFAASRSAAAAMIASRLSALASSTNAQVLTTTASASLGSCTSWNPARARSPRRTSPVVGWDGLGRVLGLVGGERTAAVSWRGGGSEEVEREERKKTDAMLLSLSFFEGLVSRLSLKSFCFALCDQGCL